MGDAARVDELLELGLPKRICKIVGRHSFIIQVKLKQRVRTKRNRSSFEPGNNEMLENKKFEVLNREVCMYLMYSMY